MFETVKRSSIGFLTLVISTMAIVILGAAFSYSNFQHVTQQQEWVSHTFKVLSELDQILSSMKDAETGSRGYMITGDTSYLDPYSQGTADVHIHYQQLKALVADNPTQLASAQALEQTLEKRLAILDRVIKGFNRDGIKKIVEDSKLDEGRAVMVALRSQVGVMKQSEEDLLRARTAEAVKSVFYFRWTLIFSTTLILLVMAYAFRNIYQNQQKVFAESQQRARESWLRGKVAEAAQLLVEEQSFERVSRKVLDYLSQLTPLLAANFYWFKGRGLNLISSYAAAPGEVSHIPQTVTLQNGGLLAEAFKKNDVMAVDEIPSNYFQVSSSLGHACPSTLVFLPIQFQGKNLGIIEMASFAKYSTELFDLLKLLADTLGVGLNAAQTREELQAFLERTQQQAEELQTQQEELRTTNEELEQQARALETQQVVLGQRNSDLESTRREVESKARDLERESAYKSDFLAKMSHELRTPLNSLLILATLLIENKEKTLTDQQRDFAKSIRGAGNDLLNLINDILDLSKIEARKLTIRAENFTLKTLFDNLEGVFEPIATQKGLKLVRELDATLSDLELSTDRMRLEQVLRNFMSNAIKFTEAGEVRLAASLDEKPGFIALSVTDTGIGIPESKRDVIFDAFEQADGSVSRKFGGTGLGLTISRELSALLGGSISLESLEDEGSTFTIHIPISLGTAEEMESSAVVSTKEAPARGQTPKMPPSSTGAINLARESIRNVAANAKSLLIVEDDDNFRKSVVRIAEDYGFVPIEAASGDVALEILNRHVPSAILLDVKLPVISGMGLLEMIKKRPQFRHIPIHMISAMDYQQSALRLGAMGYLGKPVSIENVREALGRIESLISKKVKRLLVVEDDKRQREAIVQLVSGKDIDVQALSTGEEAFKAMKEVSFDCIILDLSLPDVSGFDVLGRLSALSVPLPPIVIYTAQELTPEKEEYLRKYSESIIIKGVRSPERLLDEVNLFLHRVDAAMPDDKRAMLEAFRSQDKVFQGKRVLLVDDDMRNVFALTSALEGKGFIVNIARNGLEALDAVEKTKDYDVILMDLMMPKMDGLEAIRRIRQMPEWTKVPIIALTAKAMKEDHERCIEAGATDYLPKPIDLGNLLSTLNVWVARKDLFA